LLFLAVIEGALFKLVSIQVKFARGVPASEPAC